VLCACVCARNALETVASQHEVELQQARQQAVDEYRAKALSETADLSDTSVLADQQATSAVSDLFCIHFSSPYCIGLQYIIIDGEIEGKCGHTEGRYKKMALLKAYVHHCMKQRTIKLKITCSHLMPLQEHLYNGLSMLVQECTCLHGQHAGLQPLHTYIYLTTKDSMLAYSRCGWPTQRGLCSQQGSPCGQADVGAGWTDKVKTQCPHSCHATHSLWGIKFIR